MKWKGVASIITTFLVCLQCTKMLKNAEFMPYIIFIAAPPLDQLRYMNELNKNQTYGGSRTYYTVSCST